MVYVKILEIVLLCDDKWIVWNYFLIDMYCVFKDNYVWLSVV